MQIHKILQSQGFGSRRDCRALVRSGLVEVDGQVVDDPFAEFDTDNFAFTVDGEPWEYREKAYLMLYKPMAHECTRKPEFYPSIFSLMPEQLAERGVQPVGRLDQDTTGLLLLSDDGQFIHTWSSGKKKIPKRYRVELKHAHTPELIDALLTGVQLHDEPAPISAAAIEVIDELHLWFTITEGKYHQVKRMIAAAGNRVEGLHRHSVGGLELPEVLEPGDWAWMTEKHFAALASFTSEDD